MSKLSLKNRSAFTIIEVVIVLAIAALIIVVVLLAVAGLQRSQRTKAMQDGAGRLLNQVINWESDQGSGVALAALPASYITNASLPANVSASTLATVSTTTSATNPVAGPIMIYGGGTCSGGGVSVGATQSATQFAVSYWSETAGAAICIHN